MKCFVPLLALAGYTTAFPSVLNQIVAERDGRGGGNSGSSSKCEWNNFKCPKQRVNAAAQALYKERGNCGIVGCGGVFTAEQLVSTSGVNAFRKPGNSDIRGPCPGLNAAANHGYLYRSGVTDRANTILGLAQAYGMSIDISEPLAELSINQFGDPVTGRWSIGGPVPGAAIAIPTNTGISYSHNNYESDSSQTRCDAYLYNGDAHSTIVSRFTEVYLTRLVQGRGAIRGNKYDYGYTLDSFAQDFVCKSDWSIAKNPLYVSAPVAGTVVAPAAYNFIINFMSNHSAENTDGWLSPSVYKSFFAITGNYPNFKWLPGQERIPDNWYRRPSTFPYNNAGLFGDLLSEFAAYPDSFRLGCNQGKVNTYVAGDPGGVLGEIGSVSPSLASLFATPPGGLPANCPGNGYNPRGPAQDY